MVRLLQREIEKLKQKLLSLCAMVEKSVALATRSVVEGDADVAMDVVRSDLKIDDMEVEIEEECLKTLALHQPVAIDLRVIIAILKINNDLERIGDLAVNIAERALFLEERSVSTDKFDFQTMSEKVMDMLRRGPDALAKMDLGMAYDVCGSDDEVDAMHRAMYTRIEEAINEGNAEVSSLVNLLSVSRHLERIADHATNIAEDVIYMISGEIIRHHVADSAKAAGQLQK